MGVCGVDVFDNLLEERIGLVGDSDGLEYFQSAVNLVVLADDLVENRLAG